MTRSKKKSNWSPLVGVREIDGLLKKKPKAKRKKKLRGKNVTLFHAPKQIYKGKVARKIPASKWRRMKVPETSFTRWQREGRRGKRSFQRKMKKLWLKDVTQQEHREFGTSSWTYQETKLLYKLSNEYQQRFPIVTDRYNTQKHSQWRRRSKEEIKFHYFAMQETSHDLRGIRLLAPRDLFDFDIRGEKHRIIELEKLLQRTNEQTENIARLTLQRRKIVKALKQHRKEVAERKKKLRDQEKLIESCVEDKDNRAYTIGGLQGYNADFGVVIRDNGISPRNLNVGLFQTFCHIPEPPKPAQGMVISSTVQEWNTPVNIQIPVERSGQRSVFTVGGAKDKHKAAQKKEFLAKYDIDEKMDVTSGMVATGVVADMYKQLVRDLLFDLEVSSLVPDYHKNVEKLNKEIRFLQREIHAQNENMKIPAKNKDPTVNIKVAPPPAARISSGTMSGI